MKLLIRKFNSGLYYLKQYFKTFVSQISKIKFLFNVVFDYKVMAAKSKVVIGTTFYPKGGVANHILALHKYLKTSNSILPSYEDSLQMELNGQYEEFKRLIEKNNILKNNILHSHVDPWFICVCERAKKEGVKWVHTYHTLYFEKDWDKGLEPWQEEINDALINRAIHADIKISIAHWLKNYLKTQHNIDTIYLPNGVDVKKCDASLGSRFTSKYGLKDFILFASGISDIKNAGDFLRLANALPDKDFVIIGRGISKEALNQKFNVPIGDNLIILGTMEHHDLLDAIAACSVFVVTSRSEGLPTVLMEAMALERSVVGVNTCGTKEVIHSDKFGYLYEHNNFDDLVSKTKLALNRSKGAKARERILEHYDWKVIAPQIDQLYNDLMNE